MEEGYLKFHEKGEGKALIELAKQYPPRDAVREFVTNSLDARVVDTTENISLTTFPSQKRLIISDNGNGMTYKEMTELPESIGYSKKAEEIDMRGEKALGLLAFGSLGDVMHIISRPFNGESNYTYTMWSINEKRGKMPFKMEKLSSRDVDKDFYGGFPHGTRIIIDRVNPHIMNKVLTVGNLKNWLTTLYNPALKKGIVDIALGRLDNRGRAKMENLEEIDYTKGEFGEPIINETIPITIKGQDTPGLLEILLFIDPEAAYDKLAVYSKDVLVYESLAELTEFNKSPVWTSGKISGYINDYFNKLILGRAGIDRKRNAFKAWYEALLKIESEIKPIVAESKKRGKKVREQTYIKEAFNAFCTIWKDFKKTDEGVDLTRSSNGELVDVIGVEPTTKRHKGRRGESKKPLDRPPGPGTFRGHPDGYKERVVQKSNVPFGSPQPIEFSLMERHLRSKLEDLLGNPTLFLNSAHGDYTSRVDLKDNRIFMRYVLELVSKEAAYYSIRKDEKEGKLVENKVDIVNSALQKEEQIKFLALQKLGIK